MTRLFDLGREEPELVEADARAFAASRRGVLRPDADPRIDPRIAARRAEVEAEGSARRRRRRARAAVGGVAFAVLAAGVLVGPPTRVQEVEVAGASRTEVEEVVAASGLRSAPPLVRVDGAAVARRVRALPWVERVEVDRRWPSGVALTVTERTAVAVAPCEVGSCLVDATGRVLGAPEGADAEGLPELEGVPVAGAAGTAVPEAARGPLAVVAALPPALRPMVDVVRAAEGDVELALRPASRGAEAPLVRLGPPERLADKLTAAATVLARTSLGGVGVLDVRVPEAPALTRSERAGRFSTSERG